jgi:DNA invertase Pin-like site-specific DNA recombinase
MGRAIAYLRVSTQQQHRSGLGIEAQRTAVGRFAEVEGIAIISEFVEAETGKGADALDRRPQPRHWLQRAPPNAPSWCPSSIGSRAMSHSFPA